MKEIQDCSGQFSLTVLLLTNCNVKACHHLEVLQIHLCSVSEYDWNQHHRIDFLDLNIRAVYKTIKVDFQFGKYMKPTNSHVDLASTACIIQDISQVFCGWLKAEMHSLRLLTFKQHKHMA